MRARGDDDGLILPIATETPKAMFRLGEYADARTRLAGLTWGAEDLPAAVGALSARHPDGSYTPPYEIARAMTLFAAVAADVAPIETVYPAIRDLEGLAAYAERGARDGFTGQMALHPQQVPLINAAFTPSEAAIAHARAIVDAFAAQPQAGVLTLGRQDDRRTAPAPRQGAPRQPVGADARRRSGGGAGTRRSWRWTETPLARSGPFAGRTGRSCTNGGATMSEVDAGDMSVTARAAALEAQRVRKMADSAHRYVRGATEQFYAWLGRTRPP